jgi:LacI family transcriptional regulator
MATMNDVARVAQVSIATVSHVINGTRFVSPERIERVHSAMEALDYTPDATARSLRMGRTDTIGLVIPDNTNPFFAELARWIEEAGFDAGYTTILANSNERPYRERRYITTLLSKRVDGLIIAPSGGEDQTLIGLLRRVRTPIVILDHDGMLPIGDVVLYDDFSRQVCGWRTTRSWRLTSTSPAGARRRRSCSRPAGRSRRCSRRTT